MSIAPKMSRKQAIILWNSLTPQQRIQFNEMYKKLTNQELMLTKINVDDNEEIQTIVLDPKDKPGISTKPFAKHFDQKLLSS